VNLRTRQSYLEAYSAEVPQRSEYGGHIAPVFKYRRVGSFELMMQARFGCRAARHQGRHIQPVDQRQEYDPSNICIIKLQTMIARSLARCRGLPLRPSARWKRPQCPARRQYSTSGQIPTTPGPQASPFGVLGSITSELDKISPRFEIQPSQIQIIKSPEQFYSVLKVSTTATRAVPIGFP
jgi:hypothetical protein